MNHRPFPTVAAYPLPAAALRAPVPAAISREAASAPERRDDAPDYHDLTARVSADIARAVRQRRYTG